jgi:hypothetical protein
MVLPLFVHSPSIQTSPTRPIFYLRNEQGMLYIPIALQTDLADAYDLAGASRLRDILAASRHCAGRKVYVVENWAVREGVTRGQGEMMSMIVDPCRHYDFSARVPRIDDNFQL